MMPSPARETALTLSNSILDTRFRSALGRMADQGRLQTFSAPADPNLEVAGIMKKLDGGPALLFSKVNGHDMPVIGNLLSCQANVEAAFGIDFTSKARRKAWLAHITDMILSYCQSEAVRRTVRRVG